MVFDQSLFVKRAIETLLHEGGIGLVLTALMVLVFLGSFRATVAVFLSIPLSALAAVIALYIGGSSINTMILAGFALVFSRLIDNAVIVLENIFRHLEMGEPPEVAAEKGGDEVALAVLAATLTSSIVFFPVTFLYGVSRFLFSALALAVVLALFASYFVAMTVVPLFCAKLIKVAAPDEPGRRRGRRRRHAAPKPAWRMERFNRAFAARFEPLLVLVRAARPHLAASGPGASLVAVAAVFCASLVLYPLLGVAFFPRTDAGQFVMNVKSPSGTRIEVTRRTSPRSRQLIRSIVDPHDLDLIVSNIGVIPGFSSIYTSNAGPHTATIQVALKEDHRVGSYDYMARVRTAIQAGVALLQCVLPVGRHGGRGAEPGPACADRRAVERIERRGWRSRRRASVGAASASCPA